ncbi:MAG: tetratricopeptide repeat protein [Acidobacteriota bacterium]
MKKRIKEMFFLAFVALLSSMTFLHADYKQGAQYFKQGKYVEAASEFQTEVDQAPNYDYGFYMLGMCYMMLGKYDVSLNHFKKAIELSPDKFDYHNGLARLYLKQKKYFFVVDTLNSAASLANTPEEKYQLYYARGLANAGQKKYPESIDDLKKAKQIRVDQTILEQLGKSCYQVDDFDCAMESLKEAVRMNANSHDANYYLSKSLIEKAKREKDKQKKRSLYTEAIAHAEKAVKLKPGDVESMNLIAGANFGAGNIDKAIEHFKEVIRIKPNHCWAMINIGKALIAQQKYQDAESWLDKAVKCDVQSAIAYQTLGYVLMKQEKLEQSLEAYQKANSLRPNPIIAESIERVKNNIEVREYNKKIAELEQKQKELDEAEMQKYRELKEKVDAWKKKQEEAE